LVAGTGGHHRRQAPHLRLPRVELPVDRARQLHRVHHHRLHDDPMNRHVFGFLATFVTASLLGLACNNQPQLRSRCASDEECVDLNGRPDWICHPDRGRCACVSDEACGEQEHCEPLPGGDGYCHPNRICEWNDDCDRGEFCDIATSICRRSGCSLDVQCP